jgi:putative transposase
MRKQRHTVEEIAAKLEDADAMLAQGRLHADVAKALGISVMTYHRWRKARGASQIPVATTSETSPSEHTKRISELQLENSQLRRLVTDLLLEKMNLEESIRARTGLRAAATNK